MDAVLERAHLICPSPGTRRRSIHTIGERGVWAPTYVHGRWYCHVHTYKISYSSAWSLLLLLLLLLLRWRVFRGGPSNDNNSRGASLFSRRFFVRRVTTAVAGPDDARLSSTIHDRVSRETSCLSRVARLAVYRISTLLVSSPSFVKSPRPFWFFPRLPPMTVYSLNRRWPRLPS